MATIPRAYLDNFNDVVGKLSDDAKDKLAKALEKVDATELEMLRTELIAILQAILQPYTDNAAAVAAVFYDGLREYQGIADGFYALSESMRQPSTTASAVITYTERYPFLGDELKRQLEKQVGYEIKRSVNECMAFNAKRDPLKPKWARVPKHTPATYAPWSKKPGVTHNKELASTGTCMFCTMLASRGFAYHTANTASHTHDGCDCVIVPGFDKKTVIEGYDPDALYDEWIDSGFKVGGSRGSAEAERTQAELGRGGLFESTGINGMKEYLESSKNLDELYKRAEKVVEDINLRWNGNRNMFNSASKVAKEMRDRLAG